MEYLQFIRGLENSTFREMVRRDKVDFIPPYDSIVSDVLDLPNPTADQINKVARVVLHQDDYGKLEVMDADLDLAVSSYKKLVEESVRYDVVRTLEYANGDLSTALNKVEGVLKKRQIHIPQVLAKKWEDLDERTDDVMLQFLKYNISKGKMSLLASFSGIGKTQSSLCFAQLAIANDHSVHMIALKDWSEAELKRKTSNMVRKELLAFSVYGDCTLADIDYEISKVGADIVIIDALTDIDMVLDDKLHRTIGDVASTLRAMAVKYDCHIFTTHQCNMLEAIVSPSHLRDSKSNLLQPVDIAWGLGASSPSDTMRVVSTLKVRHQESARPFKVVFDYQYLEMIDKGLYDEKGGRFFR